MARTVAGQFIGSLGLLDIHMTPNNGCSLEVILGARSVQLFILVSLCITLYPIWGQCVFRLCWFALTFLKHTIVP